MDFHWSLSDSKSPQVTMNLFCILADLKNPLISESFSPFLNPMVTVPNAPMTIGISVSLMFHSLFFFSILLHGRDIYLSFWFPSVLPCGSHTITFPTSFVFCLFLFYCWWFSLRFDLLKCLFGGARSVMVIVVGNEHGDTSSNPRRGWLHFT